MSENDCIFCRIVAGEIPCHKLYEDDATLAFMDINPANPGHTLVIPKDHWPHIGAISDAALARVAVTAGIIARAVTAALAPDGLNLVQANGPAAAQSVAHFHLHVLPRRSNDGLRLNWGLNPGQPQEVAAYADRIRTALESNGKE